MDVEPSKGWTLNQVKDEHRNKSRMNVEPFTMQFKPYPGLTLNQAEDGC